MPDADLKTFITDPRDLGPEDMQRLGVRRVSRGDAIRQMCLACMGGSPTFVRECESGGCPLYWFRMGTDPFREAREMSDEQRAVMAERLAKAREARAA